MAQETKKKQPRINLTIETQPGRRSIIDDNFIKNTQFLLTCWIKDEEYIKNGVLTYVSVSKVCKNHKDGIDTGDYEYVIFSFYMNDEIGIDPKQYSQEIIDKLRESILSTYGFMVVKYVLSNMVSPQIYEIVEAMPSNMDGVEHRLDGINYQFSCDYGKEEDKK